MSGGYYSPFAPNAQQTAKPASGSKSMGSETMNIRLTVVNGKQLKAKDLFTSDPYVIVSVGIEQRKTKTIMKNLNPTWGDSFEFYNVTPGTMATFTVMDYDKHGKDDPMGNASLVLQKLQPGHMATNELPLSTKGSICVQYTIISNPSSAKQSAGSYPQQQPGAYPPQQGYPQQQQGGYPPQQGYGQPGAYPGYPPQGGYPHHNNQELTQDIHHNKVMDNQELIQVIHHNNQAIHNQELIQVIHHNKELHKRNEENGHN
ncbi:C2 domain-containing protein [Entamoeba histolytica HM-1:IMSS-B]|uniref:C2 domain-containing protein n=1 Tax=Entamoeba histolytica HM-1:IMSS-B TaxID=885319 RepID=M3UQ07_ENTH1|nr:C2 domain-containing protein [Entamoeba histolytica HM-1:IMSS-B]